MYRKISKYQVRMPFYQQKILERAEQRKNKQPPQEEQEEYKQGFIVGVLLPLALTYCFWKFIILK